MNDRSVGLAFLAMGAFVFSSRYIAAAIYKSGTTSFDSLPFDRGLANLGPYLLIVAIVCTLSGLFFFARGERQEARRRNSG